MWLRRTVKSEFVEKGNYYGCVLDEAAVRALANMVKEQSVSASGLGFWASVNLPGRNIRANTIDELLDADLPERFSGLTMNFQDQGKYVYLNIDKHVSFSVIGTDQQWVFGKQEALSRYLMKKRRGWYGRVYSLLRSSTGSMLIYGGMALYDVVFVAISVFVIPKSKHLQFDAGLAVLLLLSVPLLLAVSIIDYALWWGNHPIIHIGTSKQVASNDKKMLILTQVIALAAVITLIFVALTYLVPRK